MACTVHGGRLVLVATVRAIRKSRTGRSRRLPLVLGVVVLVGAWSLVVLAAAAEERQTHFRECRVLRDEVRRGRI
jgi:hypothetical protein